MIEKSDPVISRKFWLLFVIFWLFAISGCKEPKLEGLVSVRGTITYQGKPLEGAAVCFTPKDFQTGDRLGTGKTDARGKFELRTIGESGILPGEYVVVVIKNEVIPGKQTPPVNPGTGPPVPGRPAPSEVKSLIPKRYGSPKTSDVVVVVEQNGLADWRLEIDAERK